MFQIDLLHCFFVAFAFSIVCSIICASDFHDNFVEKTAYEQEQWPCSTPFVGPFTGCNCPPGYALVISYNSTVTSSYCQQMCFFNTTITTPTGATPSPIPNLLQCLGQIKLDRNDCLISPFIANDTACSACGSTVLFFDGGIFCLQNGNAAYTEFINLCPGGFSPQPVLVHNGTFAGQCTNLTSGTALTRIPCPTCPFPCNDNVQWAPPRQHCSRPCQSRPNRCYL